MPFDDEALSSNLVIGFLNLVTGVKSQRFYGVMVSTLDSESSNPSSNLGRTYFYTANPVPEIK